MSQRVTESLDGIGTLPGTGPGPKTIVTSQAGISQPDTGRPGTSSTRRGGSFQEPAGSGGIHAGHAAAGPEPDPRLNVTELARDVGNIVMDVDGVDQVNFVAVGG